MGYIFCLPFIIGLIALYIPNLIDTVVFSFNDTIILDGGGYTLEWLGIKWYEHSLLKDEKFVQLMWSSIGEMVVQVPTIVVFSLFFASVLNQEFKCRAENVVYCMVAAPFLSTFKQKAERICIVIDCGI